MTAARGFMGAGDLYVARFNNATGTFDNFTGPIETTKFEIKPKVDLKEMTSKGRSTYGQVIESVPVPKPFEFTVEFGEVNAETLVSAFLGTKTDINLGAGSFTDKSLVTKLGTWVEIGHMNVNTSGLVVTNSSGSTTYVLGTDYEVNYRLGMLKTLASGSIPEGATILVDGSYSAVSGTQIAGGTNAQIRAKFRLDGKNFADGLPCIVDVHEAVIAADGSFDFLANDFASVSLPGRLKTPAGKAEPFTVRLLDSVM